MKTVVIPAQITTVEDKIAGSFNLTQIMLFMLPVFWTVIVYAIFPQRMHFTFYKIPLTIFVLLTSFALAVRIKEKIILQWVIILLRYQTRPKYYLYNKNDTYLRTLDLPSFEKKKAKLLKQAKASNEAKGKVSNFALRDLIKLEGVLSNPMYTFSLRSNKKGGFNVALEQSQK